MWFPRTHTCVRMSVGSPPSDSGVRRAGSGCQLPGCGIGSLQCSTRVGGDDTKPQPVTSASCDISQLQLGCDWELFCSQAAQPCPPLTTVSFLPHSHCAPSVCRFHSATQQMLAESLLWWASPATLSDFILIGALGSRIPYPYLVSGETEA